MSAGNSSAGPLTTDRRPAENPGEKFEPKRTTPARQKPGRRAELINVWAHAYLIVGTRGRCRLVLIVASCYFCGRPHQHAGKPEFIAGKRTASCHGGRYVVHLGTVEGEVAA